MSNISDFLDSITNDPDFKNPDDTEVLDLTDKEPSPLIFTKDLNNPVNINQYLDNLTRDENMDPDTGEILTKKNIEKIRIDAIDDILDDQEEESLPFIPDEEEGE